MQCLQALVNVCEKLYNALVQFKVPVLAIQGSDISLQSCRWALYPPGRVPPGVVVHIDESDGSINFDGPTSLQVRGFMLHGCYCSDILMEHAIHGSVNCYYFCGECRSC
jgi:hypothetical protein